MKRKILPLFILSALFLMACSKEKKEFKQKTSTEAETDKTKNAYDPKWQEKYAAMQEEKRVKEKKTLKFHADNFDKMVADLFVDKYEHEDILVPFFYEDKWGLMNQKLEVLVPPQFEALKHNYKHACQFRLEEMEERVVNNVFILADGSLVIARGDYFQFGHYEPYLLNDEYFYFKGVIHFGFDTENVLWFKSTRDSSFSKLLRNTREEKFLNESCGCPYVSGAPEGMELHKMNYYLSPEGEFMIGEGIYDSLECFDFDAKIGAVEINDSYTLVDIDGNIKTDKSWKRVYAIHDGCAIVETEDEFGYINSDGNWIVKLNGEYYTWEYKLVNFNNGVISLARRDGKFYQNYHQENESDDWCIISKNGEMLAENISALTIYEFIDFGLAKIKRKVGEKIKFNIIDKYGNLLLEDNWDEISECRNGFYQASIGNESYIIDARDFSKHKLSDLYVPERDDVKKIEFEELLNMEDGKYVSEIEENFKDERWISQNYPKFYYRRWKD